MRFPGACVRFFEFACDFPAYVRFFEFACGFPAHACDFLNLRAISGACVRFFEFACDFPAYACDFLSLRAVSPRMRAINHISPLNSV